MAGSISSDDKLDEAKRKLEEFNDKFCEITKDLSIRTGSIFKVPSMAYFRWGIEITEENRNWLKENSGVFYGKDSDDEKKLIYYPAMESIVKTPLRTFTETRMANEIGWIVHEVMHSLDDGEREFRICDVGAQFGQATSAVVAELRENPSAENIVNRCNFYLIDRLWKKLGHAERSLNMQKINTSHISLIGADDESYLRTQPDKFFDIIISLAYFHNKSFPDYLDQIYRVLADDGVLVIADWHSALWDHPINTYRLLEKIGAEVKVLRAFEAHVGYNLMKPDSCPGITLEEVRAVSEHINYWIEIASNLNKMERKSRPRVHFLEAHDTSKARIQKLEDAGFSVNMDDIRKAFPKSKLEGLPKKLLRDSDFAVVMAAVKGKRGGE
ncbi:class I SAM-dependent methyltransferase [Candidatus Micrarchaeota archaeon]|nr:class I SAM-dependent methyltransferase [Candidatus Micrarchaeota archaeon]